MSGLQIRAFRPLNPTANITASTSSATVAIPGTPLGTRAIRLLNLGTDTLFVEFVSSAAGTASVTTSMPLLGNTAEVFTIGNDITHVAVVSTAAGVLYLTPGEGL